MERLEEDRERLSEVEERLEEDRERLSEVEERLEEDREPLSEDNGRLPVLSGSTPVPRTTRTERRSRRGSTQKRSITVSAAPRVSGAGAPAR
jgi:DNA repair exonuclease SbcCD ATPase subunit